MKVLSANMDTNLGLYHQKISMLTHPGFDSASRMPLILQALRDADPDILLLQEARACSVVQVDGSKVDVDSITPVVEFLKARGYEVVVTPYNPTEQAFSYITAAKSSLFEIKETITKYVTTDGEFLEDRSNPEQVKEHAFGEMWERCVAATELATRSNPYSPRIYVINVRLGLGHACRMAAATQTLPSLVASIPPYNPVIMAGDFNTIGDLGGREQLAATEASLATYRVVRIPLDKTSYSFIPFPYDLCEKSDSAFMKRLQEAVVPNKETGQAPTMTVEQAREEIEAVFRTVTLDGNKLLDHLFVRGFSGSFEPFTSTYATTADVLNVRDACGKCIPHAPSNHMFCLAILDFGLFPSMKIKTGNFYPWNKPPLPRLHFIMYDKHPPKKYALLHIRIRNDEGERDARTLYVYYNDHKEAFYDYIWAMDDSVEDVLERKNEYDLLELEGIWIDEWVRRRNGDWYRIYTIEDVQAETPKRMLKRIRTHIRGADEECLEEKEDEIYDFAHMDAPLPGNEFSHPPESTDENDDE